MMDKKQQGSSIDKEYIEHLTRLNDFFSEEIKNEIFSTVSSKLSTIINGHHEIIGSLLSNEIVSKVYQKIQVKNILFKILSSEDKKYINNLGKEQKEKLPTLLDYVLLEEELLKYTISGKMSFNSFDSLEEELLKYTISGKMSFNSFDLLEETIVLYVKILEEIKVIHKHINGALKELYSLYLQQHKKTIYGDTLEDINTHIDKISEQNLEQDGGAYEKTRTLFFDFFNNLLKDQVKDDTISHKQLFLLSIPTEYESFFGFVRKPLLDRLKKEFNEATIIKEFFLKNKEIYDSIIQESMDNIVAEYPNLTINQKKIINKHSISNSNNAKQLHKTIPYNDLIGHLEKDVISLSKEFKDRQHGLRSFYLQIFHCFYGGQLNESFQEQYKDHIATTLNEELSTKIGDIKKQQEKEKKREEEQSKKAENQIQQPKKQEEPKNLLSLEDLNNINNIKNLLEIEKIDQTISEDIVSYIEKMIIGEKTIKIHNRVKQKKLGISDEIVKILSLYLYDRGYPIDINRYIAIDKTSPKKTPTLVQNGKDDKKTTPQEDIIGKQMVQAIEQAGDSLYDQLMAYFDYNGYQFIDRELFEKKLPYIKNEEIQPIINKIKEDPTEHKRHKRVRHNYLNNYKVMKFEITVSRLAMKDNTIIGLYTDHDKRMKEIFSLIFTK